MRDTASLPPSCPRCSLVHCSPAGTRSLSAGQRAYEGLRQAVLWQPTCSFQRGRAGGAWHHPRPELVGHAAHLCLGECRRKAAASKSAASRGCPPSLRQRFSYLNVDIKDKDSSDILSVIPLSLIFINAGMSAGGTFVHWCVRPSPWLHPALLAVPRHLPLPAGAVLEGALALPPSSSRGS